LANLSEKLAQHQEYPKIKTALCIGGSDIGKQIDALKEYKNYFGLYL